MKSAAANRQTVPQTAPAADDWANELPSPSDIQAMLDGDRAMAEGRCISDAAIGQMLRRLKLKRQRERDGASK